jgi:hypothetical protein
MEEIKMPTEVVTLEDLAVDGARRYENAILESVPFSLSNKGILAVRVYNYFLDQDAVFEYTGKKTFMNIEESYLMSGVYLDSHFDVVYEVEVKEITKPDGTLGYANKYKVLDKREDMRLRAEAHKFWQDNELETHFHEMVDVKRGKVPFESLLKYAIETDALKSGDIQNRKMAVDIYGLKNKNTKNVINVYVDGGGNKLAKGIGESSGNQAYQLLEHDDE